MYHHRPVLLKEVLEYLNPRKNQNFIDCTLGGGGHALAILEKTKPEGKILGIDLDESAFEAVRAKSEEQKISEEKMVLVRDNFKNLENIVASSFGGNRVYGVLIDVGLSSALIETSGRGFTFQKDEPLDMRFDTEGELTAAEIVNEWKEEELAKIFKDYGEEKQAKNIARKICQARKERKISTTFQLIDLIGGRHFSGKKRFKHPATRIFQALRIAVNDELENLKKTLVSAAEILSPGGRLAVISFHSLEDRIVKQFFHQESRDCLCPPEIPVCRCGHKATLKIITKKPMVAREEESRENPRARSAKLRVAEKLAIG